MKNNPYVGPRPYSREDQDKFYGRDRESRDLVNTIIAERVVLFYAQSGAGKSSLLNARVIPDLEEEGFYTLPIARVSNDPPPEVDREAIANIFIFSTLLALADPETPVADLTQHTLCSFLQTYHDLGKTPAVTDETVAVSTENLAGDEDAEDALGVPLPILIWDQFEELFTTHQDRWQEAEGFFLQVREALDTIPELGVIL